MSFAGWRGAKTGSGPNFPQLPWSTRRMRWAANTIGPVSAAEGQNVHSRSRSATIEWRSSNRSTMRRQSRKSKSTCTEGRNGRRSGGCYHPRACSRRARLLLRGVCGNLGQALFVGDDDLLLIDGNDVGIAQPTELAADILARNAEIAAKLGLRQRQLQTHA